MKPMSATCISYKSSVQHYTCSVAAGFAIILQNKMAHDKCHPQELFSLSLKPTHSYMMR